MVDVEQGALRSLQQHRLPPLESLPQQQSGVGDAVGEAFGLCQQRVGDLAGVQCLAVVDLDQYLVLEVQRRLDLGGQQFGFADVSPPDPDPGDLVLVARADAPPGGADFLVAQVTLGDLVDGDVVGHQQVGVGGDQQPRRVHATVVEAAQLGQQDSGVDDDAVADHVGHARRQNPGRDQVQREVLPGRQDHGVPGVIAALIAHHPLHPATKKIGGLPLALVTPLGSDEHYCRHGLTPLRSWLNVSSRWITLS